MLIISGYIALLVLFVIAEGYIVYRLFKTSNSGLPWALVANVTMFIFIWAFFSFNGWVS